jgi:hypothetical protein
MTAYRRTATGFFALALISSASPLFAQKGPASPMKYLPPDVVALACAPSVTSTRPMRPMRVTGGQDTIVRRTHAPGDLITINAGTNNGIEVGQEFFTRRVLIGPRTPLTPEAPAAVLTTGWVRVHAVDDELSLATITHACDSVEIGDYLEPFALPQVPAAAQARLKAERDTYGRILAGVDGRRIFGVGDFVVVDRGSDEGVTPGMRFVFYRDKHQDQNFLFEIGEATAQDVRPDSATLRITTTLDAIELGDYVARRNVEPK